MLTEYNIIPCFVVLDSFISVAEYHARPLTERCQQQPCTV